MNFEDIINKKIKFSEDPDIEEKPFDEEEVDEEEDNVKYFRKIERGKMELLERGIELEKYKKYFETIKGCDMPIKNGNVVLKFLEAEKDIDKFQDYIKSCIEEWEKINEEYQKINEEILDEETGKEIIIEMKKLIPELLIELKRVKENRELWTEKLGSIVLKMKDCGQRYGELPAYIAYRAVGMYQVESPRLKDNK